MKLWKQLWTSLHDSKLDPEQLQRFAEQNPWDPLESQELSDKIISDIQQIEKNLWLLNLVQPMVEPGTLLLNNFTFFTNILLNSKDLAQVETCCQLIHKCFKTHMDSDSIYQQRLTQAARQFLELFVKQTNLRWTLFQEKDIFDDHIALDPIHIPRLEYCIFSFGMSKPLIFYGLLNELGMSPQTRLHCFTLLKVFLILEDAPTYYLIDSDLYKTVIESAVCDDDVSVFLTAITILTILLPIVAVKAVKHLENLTNIMIKAIKWDVTWPFVLQKCQFSDQQGFFN
jgi:hypothetical protein